MALVNPGNELVQFNGFAWSKNEGLRISTNAALGLSPQQVAQALNF